MNKAVLKEFAIESRKDLMDRIQIKLNLFYVDEKFNSKTNGDMYVLSNENHILNLTKEENQKRELLIKRINEIGLDRVIEEAAYTWFNRLIAIRYMEIHDFLPLGNDNESLGIRVLSSNDNKSNPEILKFSNLINTQLDIGFNQNIYTNLNSENEKFKYILQLVCNKLKKVFPVVFDGVTDYIDILIPENMLSETGFVSKMINKIPQSDFDEVEIIGWLYQYYNQAEKDRVISAKKVYKKHEIAYATQLFTPDWIVKYMVENTLGKYYIEHGGSKELIKSWKYYINDITSVSNYIDPKNIKFIDPCCGSGHILVYAFDLFYKFYENAGYNKNDIPDFILRNNIYGLDIDDRAGQLSILSILLKARSYDKNLFNKEIIKELNVMSIQEFNDFENTVYSNDLLVNEELNYLLNKYNDSKEIGSLNKAEQRNFESIYEKLGNNIFDNMLFDRLKPIIKQNNILSNKYDVVVTNPPYLNNSLMSSNMKKFLEKEYSTFKNDLFSAFIIRNILFSKENGYVGFMTPYVWMFISAYESLREYIFENVSLSSLIQLEYSALSEATVPICSFVLKNSKNCNNAIYYKLTDFVGGMDVQKQKFIEINRNNDNRYIFKRNSNDFKKIPGIPLAYFLPQAIIDLFDENKLGDLFEVKSGISPGNTNLFIKHWYEVDYDKIDFDYKKGTKQKWFPANKGGSFRKWYGNKEYIMNWENEGEKIINYKDDNGKSLSFPRNLPSQFKKHIGYSRITSGKQSFRLFDEGFLFTDSSAAILTNHEVVSYEFLLGLLNTKITSYILEAINPTINTQAGDICKLPVKSFNNNVIDDLVKKCIKISKDDYDENEISYDFNIHPIVKYKGRNVKESYENWRKIMESRTLELKEFEEEINRIFILEYGLKDIVEYKVYDDEISLRKPNEVNDIKTFINYIVGVIFGRYSIDNEKFTYVESTDKVISKDNVISIFDNSDIYYEDDIIVNLKLILVKLFGNENLNDNLDYLTNILGRRGTESYEETLRRYFVNDFYCDHLKLYQKKPIYWLVDSGKNNGFKALIYIHRYNKQLLSKIRVDYLHKIQDSYERIKNTLIVEIETGKDIKNNQAKLNNIILKLDECSRFDEEIGHLANQSIELDLDDGIKVNYDKLSTILAKIK